MDTMGGRRTAATRRPYETRPLGGLADSPHGHSDPSPRPAGDYFLSDAL